VSMARAAVEAVRHGAERTIDNAMVELADRLHSLQDELGTSAVFGRRSLRALTDLKSGQEWVDWLQEQLDAARKDGARTLQEEMAGETDPGDNVMRWEVDVEFQTTSHSVRRHALNFWNKKVDGFQFKRGGSDDKIVVTMRWPGSVRIESLWGLSIESARLLGVALSAGTFGLFWWPETAQTQTLFHRIRDLRRESDLKLLQPPAVRPLTKKDLTQ